MVAAAVSHHLWVMQAHRVSPFLRDRPRVKDFASTCQNGAPAVERDCCCRAMLQILLDDLWQLHTLEGICPHTQAGVAGWGAIRGRGSANSVLSRDNTPRRSRSRRDRLGAPSRCCVERESHQQQMGGHAVKWMPVHGMCRVLARTSRACAECNQECNSLHGSLCATPHALHDLQIPQSAACAVPCAAAALTQQSPVHGGSAAASTFAKGARCDRI